MTVNWTPLQDELDLWRQQDLSLPLWWRDDDAQRPTGQLTELVALSEAVGLPVHLAVIPDGAVPELARLIDQTPSLIPVVHGWTHQSHAHAGQKKAEFGAHRPMPQIVADASNGLHRLQDLFGEALVPLFVPPWNRIDPEVVAALPALGYRAISTYLPRKTALAAPQLLQINTHLDPINWRGDRSLEPPDALVEQVTQHLRNRRMGDADNTEPYGVLTHHLVHDRAIWDFTGSLLKRLLAGPGRIWTAHDIKDTKR